MSLYEQNDSRQNALSKLREAAIDGIAAQKIAQRYYEQAQAQANKWEEKYQLALKEGIEDLIRHTNFQKECYQAIANRWRNIIEEQKPRVEKIKITFKSWKKKVYEANNDKNKVLQIESSLEVGSEPDNSILSKLEFSNFEDVDAELQRLKEELLRPQTTTSSSNMAIDAELEALRKQLDQI